MAVFTYTAVLASGERVRSTLRSRDRRDALRRLRELGCHPLKLAERTEARGLRNPRELFLRVSTTDLSVFTRQTASLLKAGLPMLETLRTLRGQCANRYLRRIVQDLEERLSRDAGNLSDALDEYPRVFDPVYRGLVRSGEEGGNLVEQLQHLAGYLSRTAKLRGQVLGAFIYPIFLLILGVAAVFVLMSFVIPRFQELFKSLGQKLPWPTEVLIAASDFLSVWWPGVLGGALGAVVLAVLSFQRPSVRERLDRVLLRLPVLGAMSLKIEVARISRTLAALLRSGVRMIEALRITQETVGNLVLKSTFPRVIEEVSGGKPLAEAFGESRLYPGMMVNLVRTGEGTGEVSEMLSELSEIYETEAERAVTQAVKLLEPILIVVMGLVIASIVGAVILPIFQSSAIVS